MQLQNLTKTTQTSQKRIGRGLGSGHGKTAGRGTKGQKARGKVKLFFEGGALPLTKRLPFLRGRGRNASLKVNMLVVNVGALNVLPAKSKVDAELLVKKGIVSSKALKSGVKILGDGELKTALNVMVPVTAQAKIKIEKAGGTTLAI